MRITSGVTDQVIYFVAVDSGDLKTRETGLSSFTVYRDRNGAGAAAMTTPTVTEVDATNMPGVYKLLLDEDMTIGTGNDTEEMVFHITQASMAPVTRTIELYRPKITAGNTLTVASDGDLTEVNTLTSHTAQSGDNFARLGAPAGASVSADIAAIEAQTDDIGVAGAGLTAIPWNAAWDAQVESEVTDGLNAYDPPTKAELDAGFAALNDPTAGAIADQVWEEAIADHSGTGGSTAEQLAAAGAGGDPWSTAVPGAYGAGTAGNILGNNLDAAVSTRSSHTAANVRTEMDSNSTQLAAIVGDTNELQGDWTDGGRLDLIIDAILADTGTDGVVISAATAQAIADEFLKRDVDNVEGTAALHSLTSAILAAVSKIEVDGTDVKVYRTNGTTVHMTRAATTDATNDPLDSLGVGA